MTDLLATFNANQQRALQQATQRHNSNVTYQPTHAAASTYSSSNGANGHGKYASTTGAASSSASPASASAASTTHLDYAAQVLGSTPIIKQEPTQHVHAAASSQAAAASSAAAAPPPAAPPAPSTYTPPPSASLPPPPSASSYSFGPKSSVIRSATHANVSIRRRTGPDAPMMERKCPECKSGGEVIEDMHEGQMVCTECGLVLGTVISEDAEWRNFSDRRGSDPNRVGGPESGLLAEAGLATVMGESPTGMNSSIAKLQNQSALTKNHRALMDAFKKCNRMSSMLALPQNVTDRANELYKRVVQAKSVKWNSSDALMAACLYMILKSDRTPRTLNEMAGASEAKANIIAKYFKRIKAAGLAPYERRLPKTRETDTAASSAGASMDEETEPLIQRWGNYLKLPLPLIRHAINIAAQARKALTSNPQPTSLAAAALFIVSHFGSITDRKTCQQVEVVSFVGEGTMLKTAQSVWDVRAYAVPSEYQHVTIPGLNPFRLDESVWKRNAAQAGVAADGSSSTFIVIDRNGATKIRIVPASALQQASSREEMKKKKAGELVAVTDVVPSVAAAAAATYPIHI